MIVIVAPVSAAEKRPDAAENAVLPLPTAPSAPALGSERRCGHVGREADHVDALVPPAPG